jgi:hypothetical protein
LRKKDARAVSIVTTQFNIISPENVLKADAFLLRDAVTILLDCGLRPEECFRGLAGNIRTQLKGKRLDGATLRA